MSAFPIIDCDVAPFCPEGWEVVEHRQGGRFEWDPAKIGLYLAEKQKKGTIQGHRLRKILADRPVLNANILDYLLGKPHLTPKKWEGEDVFFWGTIYRRFGDGLYVRCLHRAGKRWISDNDWLGSCWSGRDPAAVSLLSHLH